jgi:hypothetical protein
MAKFNPSNYDSSQVTSYEPVKPDIYLVKAVDCKVSTTKNGNEMWAMTYEILDQDSDFYGKKLFDNIVFSPNTMNRVKLIFESFDVDMSLGDRDYGPDDILQSIAKVQVTHIETYQDKEGRDKEKSVIGFDGYFLVDGDVRKKTQDDESDIPF